jgi:endonuclease-3 related protein
MNDKLLDIYRILFDHYGPREWWPAETPFEVLVGAILTQNTAWRNVEKAIANLKQLGPLTPEALFRLPEETLAEAIRPSGYYRQKGKRLRNLLGMLSDRFECRIEALFDLPTETLREELLALSGIGPETADSILLYAAGRPVFVIDTYTIRILSRHELLPEETSYAEAQQWVTDHLPEDVQLFNEFHALLVNVGKDFCRPRPKCPGCPLEGF